MLFNSYSFLFVFLPIVLVVYWRAGSIDGRKRILVLASYVFYSVWSVRFAALMLATTSVDYLTAQRIEDAREPRSARAWLMVSMVCNLGVLALFKYFDFFASTINDVAGRPLVPLLRLVLPIGISFYTFESMSYTIDVYRRQVPALRRFIDYAHFVTMFPRLVAGPIVRYHDLAEQLAGPPMRLSQNAVEAIGMFTVGLAKKVLVGDVLAAHIVDPAFAAHHPLGFVNAWLAALGYTTQLYFDFSGYSDMAVGLGLLVGFRLPRNFRLPYAADSLSDFWRRWHISLSTWLRDYLYISLGGNRVSPWRRQLNLFVTMLLGGLWHGASWTFVLWGAYHGVGLVLHHAAKGLGGRAPRMLAVAATFTFVVFGWVMFRAANVQQAVAIYRSMLGAGGHWITRDVPIGRPGVFLLPIALGFAFSVDTYDLSFGAKTRWAVAIACLLVCCVWQLNAPSPFLYFQF
jgi:alginate O-acetyltransferase complex protein AlgI